MRHLCRSREAQGQLRLWTSIDNIYFPFPMTGIFLYPHCLKLFDKTESLQFCTDLPSHISPHVRSFFMPRLHFLTPILKPVFDKEGGSRQVCVDAFCLQSCIDLHNLVFLGHQRHIKAYLCQEVPVCQNHPGHLPFSQLPSYLPAAKRDLETFSPPHYCASR